MVKARRSSWLILIALVLLAIVSASHWLEPKERVPWRNDFAAAQAEAARTHKPVLAYFTANWCGYCQEMNHTTWADQGVANALANYVPVKIDVDAHGDLAKKYSVSGLPSYAVLDESGKVLQAGDGMLTPSEFTAWLHGTQFNFLH